MLIRVPLCIAILAILRAHAIKSAGSGALFSFPASSDAVPISSVKAGPPMSTLGAQQSKRGSAFSSSPHTFKLHKLSQSQDSAIHPLMYYQQHANRAIARHAQMTNRSLSTNELEMNMKTRWATLALPAAAVNLRKKRSSSSKSPRRRKSRRAGQGGSQNSLTMPVVGSNGASGWSRNSTRTNSSTAASDAGQGFSETELKALAKNLITEGPADVGNTLGLDIQANDNSYFAEVKIGTPPKSFRILIDTGSADFWVPGDGCATCGNHQTLGARESSTFATSTRPFEVVYGSGNVRGMLVQDTVNLGNLTLTGHVFGATNVESEQFGSNAVLFDGLMGTAISTLSNQRVLTPIEALAKKGLVNAATMGYAIGRVSDGVNVGTTTFGGVNAAQIAGGQLLEVPNVSKLGFWEAAIGAVTVDDNTLNLSGRTAILDTGTTLALIPPADAAAIHAAIPGAVAGPNGLFSVPCRTTSRVAFSFGGRGFAIEPEDLLFQPLDPTDLQGDCISSIMGASLAGSTQYLLGDAFLKGKYFATNVDHNVIGLGEQFARTTTQLQQITTDFKTSASARTATRSKWISAMMIGLGWTVASHIG